MATWPQLSIEISFDSDAIPVFKQSDADWDSGTGTWLGTDASWTSVTSYVLAFGYTRGRQRQLARIEAGTAYLTLDNADGRFDPENTSSPYYGAGTAMRPGKHLRISAQHGGLTYDLFYGMVTAWRPEELSRAGSPIVRVEAADMIAWIARGDFSWNYGSSQSGTIVGYLLQEILKIPSSAFLLLDEGATLVQDAPAATGNPWSEIQAVAEGEEGLVFVNGAGKFVYHDHTHRFARERSIVLQAQFDNDPTAIAGGALPFTSAAFVADETEFYTRVTTTRAGGSPQTITIDYFGNPLPDRFFVREYRRGVRSFSEAGALNASRRLADRFRALFVDHHLRQHTSVTIAPVAGPAALWPVALGLEISDQVQVRERLYPGARSRLSRAFVEGMTVDVDLVSLAWTTTFRLSRALSAYFWNIRGKGVAFPTFPLANDLYFRQDLGLLCFYDGFRWLTTEVSEVAFTSLYNQPFSAGPLNTLWLPKTSYSRYLVDIRLQTAVATTNNGSNYWTATVYSYNGGANLGSANTASNSANVRVDVKITPSSAVVDDSLSIQITKTGSPGSLEVVAVLRHRLIVT
jgi:hypothetical protein